MTHINFKVKIFLLFLILICGSIFGVYAEWMQVISLPEINIYEYRRNATTSFELFRAMAQWH